MIASSWICGRLITQSEIRANLDSPMRLERWFGSTPIQSFPITGTKWWEQALRTAMGPTTMSSFRCSTFGNLVTAGQLRYRPLNTS